MLKLVVWAATGSVSVLAETFHSGADLVGSTISYLSVRVSDTPPDKDHAYGHGKYENVSSLAIALLISLAAIMIIVESFNRLRHAAPLRSPEAALAIMAIATVVNFLVSRRLLKVGKETDSPALVADGHHLGTDVITSAGVFGGLVLVTITHQYWIDSATAIAVAVFIFMIGIRIGKEAFETLTDAALPQAEEDQIRATLDADRRVLSYHKLRTRKAGSHRHVDVHILIDDSLSFVAAHRIAEEVEEELRSSLPNLHPIIHAEPYQDEKRRQEGKY